MITAESKNSNTLFDKVTQYFDANVHFKNGEKSNDSCEYTYNLSYWSKLLTLEVVLINYFDKRVQVVLRLKCNDMLLGRTNKDISNKQSCINFINKNVEKVKEIYNNLKSFNKV